MKVKITVFFLLVLIFGLGTAVSGQTTPWSERLAATAMTRLWPDPGGQNGGRPARWTYELGVVLKGEEAVWLRTGDGKYFRDIQQSMDRFIEDDGTIRTYRSDENNLDNILLGRMLLTLYKVTGKDKYRIAASHLRDQLRTHPRTQEGGFWHKQIYPNQMWLDGLYMAEPFYAEYAATFGDSAAFDDIANQFAWVEKHTRDPKTGLLYHGWDESKKERWADPATGHSPNFWGRAMGWYAMALVDTLDYFPATHPRRVELVAILRRTAAAIEKYQDRPSGLWYQVLDRAKSPGNYLESSAACMFVYALAKGVRNGNLPDAYLKVAGKGYSGMLARFVKGRPDGDADLDGTVSVAGLGNKPYRDGSYEYYLSEKVVTNDPKGVGACLMALTEMESSATWSLGRGQTVLLDSFYNHEVKKDSQGKEITWHYKWGEMPDSGYWFWGRIFNDYGARTEMLSEAPTRANLRAADIYIIVDPDTAKETPTPNYIETAQAKVIAEWVKAGGVLVLLGNDTGNVEFDHLNELAGQFGIHFNGDSLNRVQGNEFATGRMIAPAGNPIFAAGRVMYLKEISSLKLTGPAKPVLEGPDFVAMAVAKYGKGTVFALGDPWLYNEYTDGRKLPPEYQNFAAAKDLSRWLLAQARGNRRK
jgi:unsaturated rhamnogalacturonyl hydrolase